MIMKLLKYYRNEIFTYWFYSLIPFLVILEFYIYSRFTIIRNPFPESVISIFCIFAVLIGGGLLLVQFYTHIRFLVSLGTLAEENKAGIHNEVLNGVKRGKYLITEDVWLYYGMFSKKVIMRNEISGWERNKGTFSVGYHSYIKVPYDTTLIYLKDGSRMHMECKMDSKDGVRSELPYNSIIAVLITGLFFAAMAIYPQVLDHYAGEDMIERFLFFASKDLYYSLVSFLIVAAIGIILYVIRYLCFPAKWDYQDAFLVLTGLILLGGLVLVLYSSEKEYADLARADLDAYRAGEFMVWEGKCSELRTAYYYEWGTNYHEYADRLSMNPLAWKGTEFNLLFIEDAFDIEPQVDSYYRVMFLENTKVVVQIEKIY